VLPLISVLLATQLSVQDSTLIPADSICSSNRGFAGPCITIRGRVSLANGGYPLKIWPVGTKRLLAIDLDRCGLPQNIQQFSEELKDVYADLVIRPITTSEPGVMQMVCVERATNTRTRPAALVTPRQ